MQTFLPAMRKKLLALPAARWYFYNYEFETAAAAVPKTQGTQE